MKEDLEFMVCPEGHSIARIPSNFGREYTGEHNADMEEVFEGGLYCHGCDKVYGLTKLKNKLKN
jgi:uncharacterized protein YbaR (Trm112 family)